MNTNKTSKGLIGAGLLSAIAASLCCITPLLALIAGSAGFASAFAWLEPARPYLIGVTILVIGFAWYQKLKPKKADVECNCENDEKPSLLQTKTFLGIVTAFAFVMIAFPYYSHVFFPKTEPKVIVVQANNIVQANFDVSGMTCVDCEQEVEHEISQLPGFVSAKISYETGKATVEFDKSKTSLQQVAGAINKTGYKVVNKELIKK